MNSPVYPKQTRSFSILRIMLALGFLLVFLQALFPIHPAFSFRQLFLYESRERIITEYQETLKEPMEAGDEQRVEQLREELAKRIDALVARPEKDRQQAIENIKAFRQHNNLMVTYVETSFLHFQDENRTEIYEDNEGMTYWVDRASDQVIRMFISPGHFRNGVFVPKKEVDSTVTYKEDELKESALEFLESCIPQFSNLLSMMTYESIPERDGVYFFRWKKAEQEPGGLKYVQVGVSGDGEIQDYINYFPEL